MIKSVSKISLAAAYLVMRVRENLSFKKPETLKSMMYGSKISKFTSEVRMICKFSSSMLLKSMFWIVILWPRSTTALINITIKKGKKPLTEKTPFICSPFCRHQRCENLRYKVLGSRCCRKRALKPRFCPLLSRKFRARTRLRFLPFV